MKALLSLMMCLSILGCTRKDFYDLDAISDATHDTKTRTLRFTLRMESANYTPGALIEKKADGTYFKIVRCRVGKQCEMDLPVKATNAANQYEISVPAYLPQPVHIQGKTTSIELK